MSPAAAFLVTATPASLAVLLAVKTTALAAIGLLIRSACRRTAASGRHAILGATMLAIVLLPAGVLIGPDWSIRVPIGDRAAPEATAVQAPAAGGTATRSSVPGAKSATETTAPSARPARDAGLPQVAAAVYVSGLAATLAYLLAGFLRIAGITRRAERVSTAAYLARFATGRRARRADVRLSAELAAPLTWGFLRPVILLPGSARDWPERDVANAIRHELAHVDRHDWLLQVVARLACTLHWFNPLVWMTARGLVDEAEHAADDRVLATGTSPEAYATQLVGLARSARRRAMPLAAAAPMASARLLERRIRSILDSGERTMIASPVIRIVAIAMLLAAATAIAAVQPVDRVDEPRNDSTRSAPAGGLPPLHVAAETGDLAEVRRLIEAGADVHAAIPDSFGDYERTALTTAARAGHTDIVRLLLDAGAVADRVVPGDATALIEALRNGHDETAALLLERGADPNLTVVGDGTPLIAAAAAGDATAVRMLLGRGADPDTWVDGDESPLFHAAAGGHTEIVRLLIDAGVDVNQSMPGDGNALIIAIRNGHDELADLLLDAGARGDAGIKGDGNGLIVAAERGDVSLLRKMIAAGADVNAAVVGDGSPLIQAARNRHLEAARLLVDAGADVNQYVFGDETPLIGAAWEGDVEMVNYLLGRGADPTFRAETYGGRYRSALSQARREGHTEVVRILEAAGAVE